MESDEQANFPLRETADNGRFRIESNLYGFNIDRVDLAVSAHEPSAQFLVSSTDRQVAVPRWATEHVYSSPGVFGVEFIGTLDEHGSDEMRTACAQQTVVIERLPVGSSIRKLVPGVVEPANAVRLAIDVGRILVTAAQSGRLLLGTRPETIWALRQDGHVRVTGLSERSDRLFRSAKAICYTHEPAFERRYTVPEIPLRQPLTDRSLSFLVAMLLAEWLTGSHPFPDAFTLGTSHTIIAGEHAPLHVPAAVESLLLQSLRVAPAERPSLASLIASLRTAETTLRAARQGVYR